MTVVGGFMDEMLGGETDTSGGLALRSRLAHGSHSLLVNKLGDRESECPGGISDLGRPRAEGIYIRVGRRIRVLLLL